MKELIITNGDSAVQIMQRAKIKADILPWRDVLHDGPVPADLNLPELAIIRAEFISDQGWAGKAQVLKDFQARDAQLASFKDYGQLTLWFEHDLYDQLQILQILDWMSGQDMAGTRVRMICTEQYLGRCTPAQMLKMREHETDISKSQCLLAQKAWAAFRAPHPQAWRNLLDMDTSDLPFLHDAILRQLQEYPHCESGLSLSEVRALNIIADGVNQPGRVFGVWQKGETRQFMGDLSFFNMLDRLYDSSPRLIKLSEGQSVDYRLYPEQTVALTPFANAVITDSQSAMPAMQFDYWIGGVHQRKGQVWCWDDDAQTLSFSA
ncbi:MAG: hypothetical protein V3V09_01880 [Arenicellales bacterium]